MSIAQTAIRLTNTTRKYDISTQTDVSPLVLVEELTDTVIEKINGGVLHNTPETTGETRNENGHSTPLGIGYNGLGATPYYSPLPKRKLPRLDALDPSTRTSPKNIMVITIPLPTI